MKTIGLIAPNWATARMWVQENFDLSKERQFTTNAYLIFENDIQIRYIAEIWNARGLELVSLIKLPGWEKKWPKNEYADLKSRVRIPVVREKWKDAYKAEAEHCKQLETDIKAYRQKNAELEEKIKWLTKDADHLQANYEYEKCLRESFEKRILELVMDRAAASRIG